MEVNMERILVAVDGSEQSTRSVRLAANMARKLGAEMTLVYVIEQKAMPTLIDEAESTSMESEGRSVLSDAEEIAVSEGARTRTVLLRGHPATQVNRYASENHMHMIFTGSRGRGGAKSLLLGSVSQGILQGSKIPIVIVR